MDHIGDQPSTSSFFGRDDDDDVDEPAPAPAPRRRGFFRRHKALTVLTALAAVAVLAIGMVALYINNEIGDIPRVQISVPEKDRPAAPTGKYAKSMNILLAGADNGDDQGDSIAETVAKGAWRPGVHRSDTIMVLHLTSDRKHAYLISVPRDTYTTVDGYGKQKINAAFNKGPALLIQTIENNTGLRIDHYVEVGFGGFASVIDSVGGINMCLPKAMKDKDAHIDLPAGCQELDGVNALGYVRSRKADGKNDFGRTERQRQMVGAVAKKAASPSTFLNPVRYFNVATKGVDALTVDQDMSLFDFVRFARGMQAISGSGGVALSVPTSDDNYGLCCNRGSAVKWDTAKAKALFDAIKNDNTTGLKSS